MNMVLGIGIVVLPILALLIFGLVKLRATTNTFANRDAQNKHFMRASEETTTLFGEVQQLLASCPEHIRDRFDRELMALLDEQNTLLQQNSQNLMKAVASTEGDAAYQQIAERQQAHIDKLRDLQDRIARAKVN